MNQHLSEELNTHLLKLVQKESNKEWWKNLESGRIIRIEKKKVEKPLYGLLEVFKQLPP